MKGRLNRIGKGRADQAVGPLRRVRRPWTLGAVFLLCFILLTPACGRKKEESPSPPRVTVQPRPVPEEKRPPSPGSLSFTSVLTKDLKRIIPSTSFSRKDRIYLYTTWTGLAGPHEIKVLWVRPDGKVQETVRIKENVPPHNPTFITWAYISFKKGLLNITPFEAKFVGQWKAQLFLDGKLLKEYPFSVS
jgi:hypothetical protein